MRSKLTDEVLFERFLQLVKLKTSGKPYRVTDAANVWGISRSVAHHTLGLLCDRGWIESTGKYKEYLVPDAIQMIEWLRQNTDLQAMITIRISNDGIVMGFYDEKLHTIDTNIQDALMQFIFDHRDMFKEFKI